MTFQGAILEERGVTFAIVMVAKRFVDNRADAIATIASLQPAFPGLSIILAAQDFQGTPTYFGRTDIVALLADVPLQAIPWMEYTV